LAFHLASRSERGKLVRSAQRFAEGLDPMFLEGVLQLAHQWSLQARLHIVPMFRILRVTGPLFGEANSAGEANLPVDHQGASMRTSIGAIDSPGEERMVVGNLAARIL